MKDYLVGIDIGTTNVKAGIFTLNGELVSMGSASYATYYPGQNMAEQDPEDWWKATVNAVQRMLSNIGKKETYVIRAISVSSQTPALVAMGIDGEPLRDAMIWMDRRAEQEVHELAERIGYDKFRAITGTAPDAFLLLPKLYWYKKHEYDRFSKTKCILQVNGYVNYRLTGEYSMDVSSAMMTGCVNIQFGEFDCEIESAAGINFSEIFPRIYDNSDIIGKVSKTAAEELGISKGIPVVAGTTDTIAALLSFGLSSPGEAAEITGTSTLTYFATDIPLVNAGKLMMKRSPIKSIPTILNAPINATGASVKWYLENIGINHEEAECERDIYEVFTSNAVQSRPGAGGLLYFPYMMGERGPLWNSYAKGMFIGMTLDTGYKEMARAILEGTSYALKHICEEARTLGVFPKSMRVSGGGAKNELWLKIKASVLDIPVLVPDDKSGNAILGDALLAGKGVEIYTDVGQASKEIVSIKKIIEPNPEWVYVYRELYPYYRKMYQHLDQDLKELETTVKFLYNKG